MRQELVKTVMSNPTCKRAGDCEIYFATLLGGDYQGFSCDGRETPSCGMHFQRTLPKTDQSLNVVGIGTFFSDLSAILAYGINQVVHPSGGEE